ncbi:hypothetical protein [Streptomyces sp. NPDC054784]
MMSTPTTPTTPPPPEGPEYTRCACQHIEPEHAPNRGDCLLCGCSAYAPPQPSGALCASVAAERAARVAGEAGAATGPQAGAQGRESQVDRWVRREQLGVLLSRMQRGVLLPAERDLLRAAVETELGDAEQAHATVADYENRITWETSCGEHARLLDQLTELEGQRDREVARLDALFANWNNLAAHAAELQDQCDELRGERDRARATAAALEQELAATRPKVNEWLLGALDSGPGRPTPAECRCTNGYECPHRCWFCSADRADGCETWCHIRPFDAPEPEGPVEPDVEPDDPAAWALARHIADHPASTVQRAFRHLNSPLELHATEEPPCSS